MSRSTSISSNLAGAPVTGLPNVRYRPPVVATLLASILLLAFAALLGILGVFNTITQLGLASNNQGGSSFLGAGVCGLLSLVAIAGVVYFVIVVRMGIQDLGDKLVYTRGLVAKPRSQSGRRGKDWLLVTPRYAGTDLYTASRVSDEQKAVSVDRSQIFQPRFAPGATTKAGSQEAGMPADTAPKSYLTPDRISTSLDSEPFKLEPDPGEEEPGAPRVIFRIDFASNAKLTPGEEVLVAHSRRLQHIYYVARLRNGEWEAYKNTKLI
jgi:hypothetical protein